MKKYLTLVNKEHKIKSNYFKKIELIDTKLVDGSICQIEKATYGAYIALKKFLTAKKIDIALASTYRSEEDQKKIYDEIKITYGKDYADKIVAPIGASEHHTALAIDLALKVNGKYSWDNEILSKEEKLFKTIHRYLAEFGFILRYPKGKEKITGYPYEPWHIRYVGKIPAKIMFHHNMTLEEYLTKFACILYINKEKDMTSFDVVNEINQIFGLKAGHTGTLDPLAEGVLIITVGTASKIAELITAKDKEYIAGVLLGIKTDTLDITGKVIDSKGVDISQDFEKVIKSFQKTYLQEVPIYSAVKVNGKKLYEYARNDQEVQLPKKEVTIKKIKLLSSDNDTFMIKVKVTKGCYIRSLIRDIGESLNTYATMTTLTRTKQGKVSIKNTNTLTDLKKGKLTLHTIDEALDYPVVIVKENIERKIKTGQKLPNIYKIKDKVIFKNKKQEILGIYQVENEKLRVWKNFC